jgi:enoyl-CoA hydratase/carnithine racemase
MELAGAATVHVPLLLDPETVLSFHSALLGAINADTRFVVLAGSEEGFCKGLDLAALQPNAYDIETTVETFAACLEMIRLSPKPVVAFVEGKAIGGGAGVAAACDAVLATTNATFEIPELLFRLTPAIILPYLALRMGPQKTRWMAMSTELLTSERALNVGLIDECCDPLDALACLKSLLRKMNRLDPHAVAAWKQMTAQIPHPGSRDGILWTTARLQDGNIRRSIVNFIETGIPPWMQ